MNCRTNNEKLKGLVPSHFQEWLAMNSVDSPENMQKRIKLHLKFRLRMIETKFKVRNNDGQWIC